MKEINKINLPCLRGRMGDWMYYITLLSFDEVATRVKLPKEIDVKYKNNENLQLGEWIQRELQANRTTEIVEYLKTQDQRFFNSLILGMYDGKPGWSELNVKSSGIYNEEEDLDHFSKTFGILTLTGKESIFAIDGQHRAYSIRKAVKEDENLGKDEICAIFIAHRTDVDGKIRTRRLFSTLNRYAKPVNKKEIIALSEDDNCAIITRKLVENFTPFSDKILISGNKSVNPINVNSFTSIIALYEIVERLLTDKSIPGVGKSVGRKKTEYQNTRVTETELEDHYDFVKDVFKLLIGRVPSLRNFFEKSNPVDRTKHETNLIFRPVGQKVLFDALKACKDKGIEEKCFSFFEKDDFNLNHKVWKSVFLDPETNTIITDPARQRFATLLVLEKLDIPVVRTKKDLEILLNFSVTSKDL